MQKHLKLVSGSDLRGVAVDIGNGINFDRETARSAAFQFAAFLREQTGKDALTVAVGHDPRLSHGELVGGALEGLGAAHVKVLDCGLCTTPAMFMTTVDLKCDGAIMVTASHLPFERNGMKFITAKGGLESAQVKDIALKMDDVAPAQPEVERVDYLVTYAKGLADFIRRETGSERPLTGKRIVVDAGNGSGGFFAERVLAALGADIQGSQYLDPNGLFPNHIPNPEDAGAMQAICRAVLDSHADAGVIFDADCDRAAVVDENGTPINRNRLIALLSAIYLEKCPGGTIVTDSVTSAGLTRFIEGLGGRHLRYRRGYKNVIDKAIELNEQGIPCPMGIETSGHCAFQENYFLDDGAYMAARLMVELARRGDLTSLISGLEEPAEEKEIRLRLTNEDFRPDGERIIERVKAAIGQRADWSANVDYEGVKATVQLSGGEGFILVRLSLHDPVVPVNIESDVPGGVKVMASQLLSVLTDAAGVDLSPLAAAAQ